MAIKRLDKELTSVFKSYLRDIRNLPNESAKTHRFVALVSELFPKNPVISDLTSGIEKNTLRIDQNKKLSRCRIDSYYGNAVIEFENSLKVTGTHAEDQLKEYVAGIWLKELPKDGKKIRPLIAVASDGIVWRIFRPVFISLEKGIPIVRLDKLQELILTEDNLDEFWVWLTSFLFRPQQIEATAEQFRRDFGASSLAFNEGKEALRQAWKEAQKNKEVLLAFETWKKYLTFTYGRLSAENNSELNHELVELFLKHTYLACLARLLIWASQSKGRVGDDIRGMIHQIISGVYFVSRGLANLVENDFFQWTRGEQADTILYPIWERTLVQLLTYDLRAMKEDVFKSIYQELVDPKDRHDLGEYYTPDWLCERLVEELLPKKGFVSVLDPSCGSGSFLRASISHLLKHNTEISKEEKLNQILQNVAGIDIHPLAVTIARAT